MSSVSGTDDLGEAQASPHASSSSSSAFSELACVAATVLLALPALPRDAADAFPVADVKFESVNRIGPAGTEAQAHLAWPQVVGSSGVVLPFQRVRDLLTAEGQAAAEGRSAR